MSINKRNSEGYFDPTAYEALTKIARDAKQARAYRPLIYVCSPLSGDISANQENARRYCRSVVERGGIPLAPHLLFPQFMDDTRGARSRHLYGHRAALQMCRTVGIRGAHLQGYEHRNRESQTQRPAHPLVHR